MTRALTEAGSAHCTACPALMAQLAGPSKVWDCLTRASLTDTEGLSCFTASHKVLATPVSQPHAALPALKQDAPMMISGARYSSVPTKELVRATGSARKSKVRMSDCLLMGLPCTQKHPGLGPEKDHAHHPGVCCMAACSVSAAGWAAVQCGCAALPSFQGLLASSA